VQGTGKNDVSPTFEGRSGSCLGYNSKRSRITSSLWKEQEIPTNSLTADKKDYLAVARYNFYYFSLSGT
jgi:hypothetical protein